LTTARKLVAAGKDVLVSRRAIASAAARSTISSLRRAQRRHHR